MRLARRVPSDPTIRLAALAAALVVGAATAWALLRRRRARRRLQDLQEAFHHACAEIARSKGWDRSRACVILSGGLDSCVVAEVAKEVLGLDAAFTVVASEDATDRGPAAACAAAAGLRHHVIETTVDELLKHELPVAVRVLKSFDPMALRNEIAVACALRHAASLGYTCAATGDGADELLGGYSFTHTLAPPAWASNRAKMGRIMTFGSVPIGAHLGLHVASPYTHPAFVRQAMRFGKADCVGLADGGGGVEGPCGSGGGGEEGSGSGETAAAGAVPAGAGGGGGGGEGAGQLPSPAGPQVGGASGAVGAGCVDSGGSSSEQGAAAPAPAGSSPAPTDGASVATAAGSAAAGAPAPAKQGGQVLGKLPLRRAFPNVTSALRRKDPIEVGCGTTALSRRGYFDDVISEDELAAQQAFIKRNHGVVIRDREHLHYYRVFRQTFPNGNVPGKPRDGPQACPCCRYPLSAPGQTFCVTCGHYDPDLPRIVAERARGGQQQQQAVPPS